MAEKCTRFRDDLSSAHDPGVNLNCGSSVMSKPVPPAEQTTRGRSVTRQSGTGQARLTRVAAAERESGAGAAGRRSRGRLVTGTRRLAGGALDEVVLVRHKAHLAAEARSVGEGSRQGASPEWRYLALPGGVLRHQLGERVLARGSAG